MAYSHAVTAALDTAQDMPTVPDGCESVMIQAEGGDIHYTLDGTTPTKTVSGDGALLENKKSITINGRATIAAMKFIEVTAGDTVYARMTFSTGSAP